MTDAGLKLIAYADGACKNNNCFEKERVAGCGSIILPNPCNIVEIFLSKENGNVCDLRNEILRDKSFICTANALENNVAPPNKMSNNRAELHAFNGVLARCLIKSVEEKAKFSILIKLDSEYVIKVFRGAEGWRKNDWKLASGTLAANIDYAEEMLSYLQSFTRQGNEVQVEHVDAHQKEPARKEKERWLDWFFNDFADRLSNIAAKVETDINYNVKKRKQPLTNTKSKK